MKKELKCPKCGGKLNHTGGVCADDDLECDCDQSYRCEECDQTYMINCPAHKNIEWYECINLDDPEVFAGEDLMHEID